jgi:hypothetical protein
VSADDGLVGRTAEDDVERSVAVVEALGFEVIPLLHPIRGTWQILAKGLGVVELLLAVVPEFPDPHNPRFALPGSFPPHTPRLIHRWKPGATLPEVRTL